MVIHAHRGTRKRDAIDERSVGRRARRNVSYASSEATAVREGWSHAPSSRARSRRPPRRSPRRRARSRRWRRSRRRFARFPSRRRRSRLPSRAETAGTAPLVASPPDAVPPHAPRRGGRRRHRGETRRREKGGRDGGAETRTALRLRRRGCQKRTRGGIVRIVRRSAGGARGGSRAVPRPRGRVRFPRASRRHARVGGDRGETRTVLRVDPVPRRARFPTPGGAKGRHARDDEENGGGVPGNIFSATASKIGRGMSGNVARGFGGGERRVAGTDARRLARRRAGVSDLRRVARKLRGGGGRDGDSEKSSRKNASVGLTDADADAHADAHDVEPRGGGSYSHDAAYRADAPWAWLPSMADDLRVDGAEDEPWALRLETLTSWRAHPRWLRAVAVSADEASLLTVGGAGVSAGAGASADAVPGAVRVWSSGGPRGVGVGGGLGAIASHEAHAHAPTCAAFVPGNRTGCGAALVASADAGGALHVWRADTARPPRNFVNPPRRGRAAGFGFGVGRATARDAARLRGAHVNANADTTTGASTFTRRLSDASPPGIRSGSPGAETPRATSTETPRATSTETPPPSSSSDLSSSNLPSRALGFATLDAEYHAQVSPSPRAFDPSSPSAARRRFSRTTSSRSDSNVVEPRSASLSSPVVGYACAAFAPAPANEGTLALGTSDGRGRLADVAPENCSARGAGPEAAGTVRAVCFPGDGDGGRGRGRDPIPFSRGGFWDGTRSMAGSGSSPGSVGWTCAGTSRGFVGLLDRRDGHLVSGFSRTTAP